MALATDYDGTFATDGKVAPATLAAALDALKASGRKALMVTGRHLDDLRRVFPSLDVFDRVVAENGAVLYDPANREEKLLIEEPPQELLIALRRAGVKFDVGRAIISSWTPAETTILDVIKKLALDYQVIFNKGAVMVLPSGINKATGVMPRVWSRCCFRRITLFPSVTRKTINHCWPQSNAALLYPNAVPSLRDRADVVTKGARGEGVIELIHQILDDDLQQYDEGHDSLNDFDWRGGRREGTPNLSRSQSQQCLGCRSVRQVENPLRRSRHFGGIC